MIKQLATRNISSEAAQVHPPVPLFRSFPAEVKSINPAERVIAYVITTSDIDRYGEIVDPCGLDLANFRSSKRTVFWNHDYNVPVGKSLWERLEGEKWIAGVQFAADSSARAEEIWNLASRGYIGMASIGFIPRRSETISLAELKDLHPSNRSLYPPAMPVTVWREAELLEFSLVGIAANPSAAELPPPSAEADQSAEADESAVADKRAQASALAPNPEAEQRTVAEPRRITDEEIVSAIRRALDRIK